MSDTESNDSRIVSEETIMAFVYEKVFDVSGVYGMGLSMSATAIRKSLLGQDKKTRGVRVTYDDEKGYTIDIYLIAVFDTNIPETAWNVQKLVHRELLSEFDVKPEDINIHIQGVHLG